RSRHLYPVCTSTNITCNVKKLVLAGGAGPWPAVRIRGEGEVVAAADRLVANTPDEARQLIELYGASPWRVETVSPGVDLSVFRPGPAEAARRRLGLPAGAVVLVFAGRIQPLKGPDIVLRAAAELLRSAPGLAGRLVGDCGEGWFLRHPGGRARARRLRAGARQTDRLTRAARRAFTRRAGARVRVRLARDGGPADRRVYRCHGIRGYLERRRDRTRM